MRWVMVLEGVEVTDEVSDECVWIGLVGGGDSRAIPVNVGPYESGDTWLMDVLFDAQDALYRGEVKIIEDVQRIFETFRDRAEGELQAIYALLIEAYLGVRHA